MKKRQVTIEHELKSNSANLIWRVISTPEGLAKWMADEVVQEGQTLSFTWGELWSNHEIRRATLLEATPQKRVRLRWNEDEDPDAYLEFRIDKSDVTNDYILTITDFAEEEDIEVIKGLWNDNLTRLRHSTGL